MEKKEFSINTPMGKLYVAQSGAENDYPGISIELERPNGESECLAVIEYSNNDNKMQAVIFADDEEADNASHIIKYDFIKRG